MPVRRSGRFGRFTDALFWGCSGFVAGAVFWYFVGFWGFLSAVVFEAPAPVVSVEGSSITTGSITTGSVPSSTSERLARLTEPNRPQPNCSMASLRPRGMATTSRPCTAYPVGLRYVGSKGKSRRATAATGRETFPLRAIGARLDRASQKAEMY